MAIDPLDLRRRGVQIPDATSNEHPVAKGQADTSYQPKDATLTALAGVSTAANKVVYATGSDTFSTTDFTSYGRSVVGVADEAAFKSLVNLEIGVDVQAYDAQLADIAGLTPTDNGIVIGNGSNFVVESGSTARTSLGLAIGTDVQAYDAQLADIAGLSTTDGGFIVGDGTNFVLETGNTARTSLGLGTGSSPTFTDLTLSGNLTVNGTTTTVNSTTVEVADSLYHLASNNTTTDTVDIGAYGSYGDGGEEFTGWFRDASDGKFKFFTALQEEPTTTVNVSGTGYTVATAVVNIEGTVDGINVSSLNGYVGDLQDFQILIEGTGGAADVGYDHTTSGMSATTVQAAIDEIDGLLDNLSADDVAYNDDSTGLGASTVQGAIEQIDMYLDSVHGSSGADWVGFNNATSGLTATTVQAAIDEVEARVDTLESGSGATYKVDKNATTDWGSASGGEYTITITAGTHGKGTEPDVRVYKVVSGSRIPADAEFDIKVNATNGNITIKVYDGTGGTTDGRAALHVQVRG